jgi:hypothetical protein
MRGHRKFWLILSACLLVCIGLFVRQGPAAAEIVPAHLSCTADADCAVVDYGCECCGGERSVNAAHLDLYSGRKSCTKAEIEACYAVSCVGIPKTAVCVAGQCTLKTGF